MTMPLSESFFRPAESTPRLSDGRPLRIGPVTPAAKPRIMRGRARISPATSRRRFFTVRCRFSEDDLEAMTNLDGHPRFAPGAAPPAAPSLPDSGTRSIRLRPTRRWMSPMSLRRSVAVQPITSP